MVVWGLWQDGQFLFSTGSQSRKAPNLAQNAACIVCTEHANEAVIVEGSAEIADMAARRKFLPIYERICPPLGRVGRQGARPWQGQC